MSEHLQIPNRLYFPQIYTQLWSKSVAEYQTSVMSLRYSIAFLTHMIGSSTTRHTHTHTPQSRGLKQQQLFSWHRAGALWFLEQVDYLTSSEYPYF